MAIDNSEGVYVPITGNISGLVAAMSEGADAVKVGTDVMSAALSTVAEASAYTSRSLGLLQIEALAMDQAMSAVAEVSVYASRSMGLMQLEATAMDAALEAVAATSLYASRSMGLLEVEALKMDTAMTAIASQSVYASQSMGTLEIEARKMDAAMAALAAESLYASRAMGLLQVEALELDAALTAAAAQGIYTSRAMGLLHAEALKLDGEMGKLDITMAELLAPLLAILTALQAFHVVAETVEEVTDLAVSLDILSQKTAMSVEQLTALQGAAALSNVPTEELNTSLQRLARGMDEATTGTGPAYEAFRRLGVTVTDAHGRLLPMRDVLAQTANAFAGLEDGAAKTAIGIDLFGRGFDALGGFLNRGSEGIQELEDQARSLGGVMTAEAQASLLAYDDAMDRLGVTATGLSREFVVGLAPALTKITDAMTDGAKGTSVMSVAGRALGDALREVAIVGTVVVGIMKAIGDVATANFTTLVKDLTETIQTMKDLWSEADPTAPGAKNGTKTVPGATNPNDAKTKKLLEDTAEDDRLFKQRQYERMRDSLAALNEAISKEAEKAQADLEKGWLDAFESIPRAWNSAVGSLKETTAGWGDFFRSMLGSLLKDFAAFEAKSLIISHTAMLERVKNYAIEAAAGAYAAIAGIPVVGPVLAPIAALAALAGVLALATGGSGGGGSPASTASAPARGGGGGSGALTVIYAMDAKSFRTFAMEHSDTFAKATVHGSGNGVRLPSGPGRGSA